MNLTTLATDNIAEILVKIIEFTQVRQIILIENINSIHSPGFAPKDLAVNEFSESLDEAVNEYIRSGRLVLRDTESIKFGAAGRFEAKMTVDKYAKELLGEKPDEYLELQTRKLLENSLNQRIAAELLRYKEGMISIFD